MSHRVQNAYTCMSWRGSLMIAGIITTGVMQGCTAVPTNLAAPIPSQDVDGHASLASGRKIYVSFMKCAMCHRPKPMSDYSLGTWTEDILPRMSKKARLSPQQYADVLAYIASNTQQD